MQIREKSIFVSYEANHDMLYIAGLAFLALQLL